MSERRHIEDPAFMPGPGEPFFPANPAEDWAASRLHINAELSRLERDREARFRELRDLVIENRSDFKQSITSLKQDSEADDRELQDQIDKLADKFQDHVNDYKSQQGKLIGLTIAIPLFLSILIYIIERFVFGGGGGTIVP